MRYRLAMSVLLLLGCFLLSACQTGTPTNAATLFDAFFMAEDREAVILAIDAIVESGLSVEEAAKRLRHGRRYPSPESKGWQVRTIEGIDGRSRPYHVYVPSTYAPEFPAPVLFDLHGAVSNEPKAAEYLTHRRRLWETNAEAFGWILIVPHGDRHADWFSVAGHANLRHQLTAIKREYNVDENKVFVSGFSDGGSGALWQAFHDPTPWAGMLSFHGHPAIAGSGPYQSYPRNFLNRPIRATNGEADHLYPAQEVQPYVDLFVGSGATFDWTAYPGGHDTDFLSLEAERSVAFIQETARNPTRGTLVWETSSTEIGRCDWVQIDRIADVGNNAEFVDLNLLQLPDRIVFGAALAYRGVDQFDVAGLEPGSVAHLMGVKNGDRILRIDDVPVLSQADIGMVMEGKRPFDRIEVTLLRDGEEMELSGSIPGGDPVFTRYLPTASIRAAAHGNRIDVEVRHVGQYRLLLSGRQFDLSLPLIVTTNGQESYAGVVEPSLRWMLEQAATDQDREMVYEAMLVIEVPHHDAAQP